MGCSLLRRSCKLFPAGSAPISAVAPDPNPGRWELLQKEEFQNGYALKVKYPDCTNYEGIKIMVYEGKYSPTPILDPHFQENLASPIARFRPDDLGWERALCLAASL